MSLSVIIIDKYMKDVAPGITVTQDNEKHPYDLHGVYSEATQALYNLQYDMYTEMKELSFSEKLDLIENGLINIFYSLDIFINYYYTQTHEEGIYELSKTRRLGKITTRFGENESQTLQG